MNKTKWFKRKLTMSMDMVKWSMPSECVWVYVWVYGTQQQKTVINDDRSLLRRESFYIFCFYIDSRSFIIESYEKEDFSWLTSCYCHCSNRYTLNLAKRTFHLNEMRCLISFVPFVAVYLKEECIVFVPLFLSCTIVLFIRHFI